MFKIHRIDMLLGIHSCIYLYINQWLNTIVNKSTHAMCNWLTKVMYLICLYFMQVKIKLNFIQVNYNEIIPEHVNVSWWYKGNLSTWLDFSLVNKISTPLTHLVSLWTSIVVTGILFSFLSDCWLLFYWFWFWKLCVHLKHHLKDSYINGL